MGAGFFFFSGEEGVKQEWKEDHEGSGNKRLYTSMKLLKSFQKRYYHKT